MTGSWNTISAKNTGGTDSLSTPSGFITSGKQMRYHYIEDFVGNMMEFIDGTAYNSQAVFTYYSTADPSKFGDSYPAYLNMNKLSYNASNAFGRKCVSALGWDSNNPFLVFPVETTGTDYNVYFCNIKDDVNNEVLFYGQYYSGSNSYNGVFNYLYSTNTTSRSILSSRLLYNPKYAS